MVRIRPIVRGSLVDEVVERIRGVIGEGKLGAGDRLPTEATLVEQLGVSRNVLREAIGRLECLGLVTVQRGRGMFVGDASSVSQCVKLVRSAMAVSPRELLKFTEFRKAIECYAARRAAELATAEDTADLERMCLEIDEDGSDDEEAMRRDFRFHHRLMGITGNELMQNVLEVLQEFCLVAMVQTTPRPRDRADSRRRHLLIVDAVRSGDPGRAEKAMQSHMDRTAEVLETRSRRRQAR